MKRGPKQRPLAERLSDLIEGSPNLEYATAIFPERIDACWVWKPEKMKFWDGKSSRMAIRVIFGIVCEEPLDESCRPHRTCNTPKCVNPTHHDLLPHNTDRYGGQHLPRKLIGDNDQPSATEILGLIYEANPRPPTPEAFVALWSARGTDFEIATVREAYAQVS